MNVRAADVSVPASTNAGARHSSSISSSMARVTPAMGAILGALRRGALDPRRGAAALRALLQGMPGTSAGEALPRALPGSSAGEDLTREDEVTLGAPAFLHRSEMDDKAVARGATRASLSQNPGVWADFPTCLGQASGPSEPTSPRHSYGVRAG